MLEMERLEVKSPSRTVSASGWMLLKSVPSLNQEIRIGSSPERMEQTTVALIPSLRSAPNRNGLITGFSVYFHISGQNDMRKDEENASKMSESFAILYACESVLSCRPEEISE